MKTHLLKKGEMKFNYMLNMYRNELKNFPVQDNKRGNEGRTEIAMKLEC